MRGLLFGSLFACKQDFYPIHKVPGIEPMGTLSVFANYRFFEPPCVRDGDARI